MLTSTDPAAHVSRMNIAPKVPQQEPVTVRLSSELVLHPAHPYGPRFGARIASGSFTVQARSTYHTHLRITRHHQNVISMVNIRFQCDPCRSRKVKCDKETPVCSACKASNLACVTSDRREAVKRKRIHVSDDYERKIDLIEEKLASLDQVLQRGTFPLSTPGSGVQQSSPSRPTSSATTPGTGARPRTLFEDGDQPDADGDAYEGDTSLNAHSVQARALVERVLGQGVFASTSPEVSSAVSSLLDLSNGRRKRIPKPYVQNGGGGFDYRRLPLPPTRIVLDVLRQCRGESFLANVAAHIADMDRGSSGRRAMRAVMDADIQSRCCRVRIKTALNLDHASPWRVGVRVMI